MPTIGAALDMLGAIRDATGRLRERVRDALDRPVEEILPPPEPTPGIFASGTPTVTWKRVRSRHGEVSIAREPLLDHDILIGHAEIGDLVVGFVETPFTHNDDARRTWAMGVDGDGVSMTLSYRLEPLVPGIPMASGADILRHLSASRGGPRPDIVDVIATGSHIVDGRQVRGRALVARTQEFAGVSTFGDGRRIDEAVSEVVARIAAKLGRTRLLAVWTSPSWTVTSESFAAPRERVEALERFIAARPWLQGLAVLATGMDFEGSVEEVERRLGEEHWLPRAAMRRLGPEVGEVTHPVLDVLKSLPVDWIPVRGDAAEWTAFRAMCETLAAVPDLRHAFESLLAGAKGRWTPFMERIAKECGLDAQAFLADWAKAIKAEVEAHSRLADPYLAPHDLRYRAMADLADVADLPRAFEADMEAILGETREREFSRYALANEAIVGKRGLSSLMEASRKWHADPAFQATALARPDLRWDPLLPEWTDPRSRISIVPLGSSHDLIEEGAKGAHPDGTRGLAHCVGSDHYVLKAATGASTILSLRKDGQRLSTAEIELVQLSDAADGEVAVIRTGRVLQHRAYRNGNPSETAEAALHDYLAVPEVVLAIAKAERREAELPPLAERPSRNEILDRWRPYLTGRWRTANPEGFAEAILDS